MSVSLSSEVNETFIVRVGKRKAKKLAEETSCIIL
jgi:hypothetical protein